MPGRLDWLLSTHKAVFAGPGIAAVEAAAPVAPVAGQAPVAGRVPAGAGLPAGAARAGPGTATATVGIVGPVVGTPEGQAPAQGTAAATMAVATNSK